MQILVRQSAPILRYLCRNMPISYGVICFSIGFIIKLADMSICSGVSHWAGLVEKGQQITKTDLKFFNIPKHFGHVFLIRSCTLCVDSSCISKYDQRHSLTSVPVCQPSLCTLEENFLIKNSMCEICTMLNPFGYLYVPIGLVIENFIKILFSHVNCKIQACRKFFFDFKKM